MPTRAFLIILICVVCGVIFGYGVGILLGSQAPEFCNALFGNPSGIDGYSRPVPRWNGQQLGIGLGIANGVWVGLIAGIAIVIAEAIKSLKKP